MYFLRSTVNYILGIKDEEDDFLTSSNANNQQVKF